MAKISTYSDTPPPSLDDFLLGTDVNNLNSTQNFLVSDVITLATTTGQFVTKVGVTLPTYADNAAAVSGGLAVNSIYKTSTGEVRIVV
jgi:hypothetical protein